MESITHQKARSLLQAAADDKLKENEQVELDTHLASCKECGEYAQNILILETGLSRMFHARWDNNIPKLSIAAIKERSKIVAGQNRITKLIGRMAVIPTLTLLYVLAISSIGQQNHAPVVSAMSPISPSVPLYTPSPQNTSTRSNPTECHDVAYIVQENDTLPGIAMRFGISKETLLKYNHLTPEVIYTSMELILPLCDGTPANSTTTPTITSTFVPLLENTSPLPQD
jgi:LysM repeat protein